MPKEIQRSTFDRVLRALFIVLIVLLCLALIVGTFLIAWFWTDSYNDFKDYFRSEFDIPGLDDGVVPQGLANNGSTFFVSGYMVDDSASRLYVVDSRDDEAEPAYVTFMFRDGNEYMGHAGGVATDGKYLWLCSEDGIYTVYYDDVMDKATAYGGKVTIQSSFTTDFTDTAFMFYDTSDKTLYVGEFYRKKSSPTDYTHKISTPSDVINPALMYAYDTGDEYEWGFSYTPRCVFSITERIQGVAVCGGTVVLSQSYGLGNSHIFVYDLDEVLNGTSGTYIMGDGTQLPLYYLDDVNLIRDLEIPSMSEGLAVYNGRVYVLFESAGKKYRTYVRERLSNVYSFRPSDVRTLNY